MFILRFVIIASFLFVLFGGVHFSAALKERRRGLLWGAYLFTYSFLVFALGALLSPFLVGVFLGFSRFDIGYSNTVAWLFSRLQVLFLFLLVSCASLILAGIFKKISTRIIHPPCASYPWSVWGSFALHSLFIVFFAGVFGIFVSLNHAALKAISIAYNNLGMIPEKMPASCYVSPQWYEVLVRVFDVLPLYLPPGMDLSIAISVAVLLFPFVILLFSLVNTYLFLSYWKTFILTQTTRVAMARFYVFMWVLGNIAVLPLVYPTMRGFLELFRLWR